MSKPKYKNKKFKSEEDFNKWLKSLTKYIITFKDDGQDFLTWHLDRRGEVLQSYGQAWVWNGTMVKIRKMKVGQFLPIEDRFGKQKDLVIQHKVKSIKTIK